MKGIKECCIRPFTVFRCIFPLLLILLIALCRFFPAMAEGYARHVYPYLSAVLSAISAVFPFSLEEVLVIGIILWLIAFPIWKRRKRKSWKHILIREVELLAWIYIWFYAGWGLNYFRHNIYQRTETAPVAYDEQAFTDFLQTYTNHLNDSYTTDIKPDMEAIEQEIKDFYRNLPDAYALAMPRDYQHPKNFTFTALYSGVGVLGSMGPFFAESQLNADLLPLQLPFTYAHELSHLLGVSSEAEANYWAYQVCTRSSFPEVRYSGYFGILPYVLFNASTLLPEESFWQWTETIRPEVMEEYKQKRAYWQARYSPLVGRLQDVVYDWFLKGNKISSGKKNYAEVIGIILTLPSVSHIPTEKPHTHP